jgi:hypothetical protein
MVAFFCCTLDSQVSSSSVWPCGTFEWASQESMGGGDLRARVSETERIVIVEIIGRRIRGLALLAITLQ